MKRSEFLRLAAMAPLALWAGPARGEGKGDFGTGYSDVQFAIAAILNSPDRLPLPLQRVRAALKTHYVDNVGTIYWAGTGRMTPFLQRLGKAADDGLNPDDYPIEPLASFREAAESGDPVMAARAELYYSAFFLAYASDLKIGRVIPSKIDPRLFRTRKTIDLLRVLTELKKQRDPGKFLGAFEPRNPHYKALKQALGDYRGREDETWPTLPVDGAVIKPGAGDSRIRAIREILRATGDYEWSGAGTSYDEQLVIAVRRFQARHGLEAKGNIGKQTLLAMNVGPAERARQIMLNMERWRWMPDVLGEEHIMVNIAAFELQRVQTNIMVDRMNVVVGAVATQTPEFSDELEYVELNPTWTVPYSIATKEMLPKLKTSPSAYAGDFEIFAGGKLTSWGAVNWASYGPGNFPFTVRQKPGPKNALGKVKFMLPNRHNIYLHDTPAKDKFAATTRAFSHGCIRLSRPIEFAHTILGELVGWSKAKVDASLATGKTERVLLPRKIPVHLIYATAFLGNAGEIEFRADVYGRDRKLYNALFAKPTS
jgi:murein L,D-transpeptidase YcbB/YkuD